MLHRSRDDVASPDHTPPRRGLREQIGEQLGRWWAPLMSLVARLRRARVFHPEGHTFIARVEAVRGSAYGRLASGLAGDALVRCSPALWRDGQERLEVLGIAMRFQHHTTDDTRPQSGDQDLLLATIRSPLTMALSPFTTNAHDFLANQYWAVSPFEIAPNVRVELRLTPLYTPRDQGSRAARLAAGVKSGRAAFGLEARRTLTLRWERVCEITLLHDISIDQAALRFDPFRSGRGLVPVGLVHSIRRAVYAASQAARPLRSVRSSG